MPSTSQPVLSRLGQAPLSALARHPIVVRLAAIAAGDSHAAAYDVAPGPGTTPRRPGEPVRFTLALDTAPAKAASGGWAREMH